MKPYQLLFFLLLATFHTVAQAPATAKSKLAPWLPEKTLAANPRQSQTYWLTISDTAAFMQWLTHSRARLIKEYPSLRLAVINAPWQLIDSLRSSRLINFIDMPRRPVEELMSNSFDNSVNAINLAHSRLPAVNGQGLVVSIKENKPDTTDVDLEGRYLSTSLSAPGMSAHATIMATLIAGAGNSYYTGLGVAPGCTFSSSNFASLLPDDEAAYKQYHISVQDHSYGTGIENYYGIDAAAYDATMNHDTTLIHVFSAGNSGNQSPAAGPYAGLGAYANITGSFKMAKNILTAGSVDSFHHVPALSSRGPAYDGRIKPELVAFGEDGSSGAAALVSGAALLLQQQYKLQDGNLPASALIKAVMINTADDIGMPGPDLQSGFGNMNVWKALTDMHDRKYYSGALQQNGARPFTLHIPANTKLLKITLCWNDPAAAPNAPVALLNDLDLALTNAASSLPWLPWVLNTAPVIDSLQHPAQRKRDSLNNIEQITLTDPLPGDYTISVSGPRISGSQSYSVAWHMDTANGFMWYSPAANDNLIAGNTAILRWQSTFSNTTARLDYSLDGASWHMITDTVHTATGYYQWKVPDTFALAQLRMNINGILFLSDTVTLSSRLGTRVGFNCPDSFLITWKKPAGVQSFALYELAGPHLSSFATTQDTSIIIFKKDHPARYYAIAPLLPHARTGLKSFAFDYTTQGAGCYINNFLADLINNSSAQLYLELGTLYDVRQVAIEKYTPGGFITWQVVSDTTGLIFSITDAHLLQGANTYRARIRLRNGNLVYSNVQTVYSTGNRSYVIFPNPARDVLHIILLSSDEMQFVLFNALGQQVMQQAITQQYQQLSLQGLKKGVYFYLLKKNGKKGDAGSLVIQ